MSALDRMLSIREGVIMSDRNIAMEALVRHLHYKIALRVSSGDTFTLFADDDAVAKFCAEFHIDRRAFDWLLDALRDDGVLSPGKALVALTPLGVEKLCL